MNIINHIEQMFNYEIMLSFYLFKVDFVSNIIHKIKYVIINQSKCINKKSKEHLTGVFLYSIPIKCSY